MLVGDVLAAISVPQRNGLVASLLDLQGLVQLPLCRLLLEVKVLELLLHFLLLEASRAPLHRVGVLELLVHLHLVEVRSHHARQEWRSHFSTGELGPAKADEPLVLLNCVSGHTPGRVMQQALIDEVDGLCAPLRGHLFFLQTNLTLHHVRLDLLLAAAVRLLAEHALVSDDADGKVVRDSTVRPL